jgi:stage II sporulation protein M
MWAAWRDLWRAFLKQNWLLYPAVLVIFSLGASLGVLMVNNLPHEQLAEISGYLDAFLKQIKRLHVDPAQAARSIMCENMIVISTLYFLGLTFAGIPFILVLVLIRGFILGFAVACLTRTMSWPGLFLAAVAILPHNLIYLPALVIGVVAAVSFASFTIRRHTSYRVKLWNYLLGYTVIMLTVMAITLGAGLIEVFFSPWLTRLTSGFIQTALLN